MRKHLSSGLRVKDFKVPRSVVLVRLSNFPHQIEDFLCERCCRLKRSSFRVPFEFVHHVWEFALDWGNPHYYNLFTAENSFQRNNVTQCKSRVKDIINGSLRLDQAGSHIVCLAFFLQLLVKQTKCLHKWSIGLLQLKHKIARIDTSSEFKREVIRQVLGL